MPMPALNIIAIQEMVRNSGASSSRPSGMRPYLLAASHRTKTTKAEARVTNSQPRLASIHVSAVPLAEPSPLGLRNPQATNATAMTAEMVKTAPSSAPLASAVRVGGSTMAGCWSVRGSGSTSSEDEVVSGPRSDRPGGAAGGLGPGGGWVPRRYGCGGGAQRLSSSRVGTGPRRRPPLRSVCGAGLVDGSTEVL